MNFIASALSTFTTKLTSVILILVSMVIITQTLGPEGKGYYSLLILVPNMLIHFGNLGIGIANTYYTGNNRYNINLLISNSFYIAIVLGAILCGGFLIYNQTYSSTFLNSIDSWHLIWVCLVVPFSLLSNYFMAIILGQQRITHYNAFTLLRAITFLLLIMILLLGINIGLDSLVMAWIFAELVGVIFSLSVILRNKQFKMLPFDLEIFRKTIRFGIVGYSGNIIQFFNYRLDLLFLAHFATTAVVGYYSVAVNLVEALWYIPAAVGTVLFARTPHVDTLYSNMHTPIICRSTLFITSVSALVLIIISSIIVPFMFGQEFIASVKPLWILIPGVVALSVCKVLSNELTGRGKPGVNVLVAIIALSVNIPLNVILIPKLGMVGGAIATSTAYLVASIVVLFIFSRISGNKITDILIIKKSDLKGFVQNVRSYVTKYRSK